MLKEGTKAPSFSLESDSGKRVSLADFAKDTLVVYFYPKDNTPGCTREAVEFAAAQKKLIAAGAKVVGVSKDSVKSHCGFRDKYSLNFPLLSDPSLTMHNAYGTYGDKVMYGKKIKGTIRSTFVIKGGKVTHVFSPVRVDGHVDQVLAAITGKATPAPAKKGATASKKAPAKKAAAPTKSTKSTKAAKSTAKKAPKKAAAKKR